MLILRVVTVPPFQGQIEKQRITPRTRVPDGHPAEPEAEIEKQKTKFVGEVESGRVQKGKELGGVAGAGRAARGDFTGYDRAG